MSALPRQHRLGRRASRVGRGGFTLLELLAAVALSVLLMAAVYFAFDLSARLTTTGQEEVERARLAQAVLREIEQDLRQAISPPPAAPPLAAAVSSTAPRREARIASPPVGLIGDSDRVLLLVFANERARGDEESRNAAGGIRRVGWKMSNGAGTARSAEPLSDSSLEAWFAAPAPGRGLLRGTTTEGASVDARGSGLSAAAQAEPPEWRVFASEVVALSFRYFDGREWRPTWNSARAGRLPSAVEIVVTVEVAISTAHGASSAAAIPTRVWRLVTTLPTATLPPHSPAIRQPLLGGGSP